MSQFNPNLAKVKSEPYALLKLLNHCEGSDRSNKEIVESAAREYFEFPFLDQDKLPDYCAFVLSDHSELTDEVVDEGPITEIKISEETTADAVILTKPFEKDWVILNEDDEVIDSIPLRNNFCVGRYLVGQALLGVVCEAMLKNGVPFGGVANITLPRRGKTMKQGRKGVMRIFMMRLDPEDQRRGWTQWVIIHYEITKDGTFNITFTDFSPEHEIDCGREIPDVGDGMNDQSLEIDSEEWDIEL